MKHRQKRTFLVLMGYSKLASVDDSDKAGHLRHFFKLRRQTLNRKNRKCPVQPILNFLPTFPYVNPLVPGVQKNKNPRLTLNRLLIFDFVNKMFYLGAHCSQ